MNSIITDRLVLRSFRKEDSEAVFRNWSSDERVARYGRWYPHKIIKMSMSNEYSWAITIKGIDEPVGSIDVVGLNSEGVPEIGYVLMHSHWGEGIMTEALKAVISELFRKGYEKAAAYYMIDNPASGRVMEKCGMTHVRNMMVKRKFGSDEECEVSYCEISCKENTVVKSD